MTPQVFKTVYVGFANGVLILFVLGILVSATEGQDEQARDDRNSVKCSVDLTNPGIMKDVISNALRRGLNQSESDVKAFLAGTESRYSTGQELLEAAARNFRVSEAMLTTQVKRFEHCNCEHGPLVVRPGEPTSDNVAMKTNLKIASNQPIPSADADTFDNAEVMVSNDRQLVVSKFAQDVTLHVVVHELGHALIREFDLPILGNEESMADAFATYYLTTYFPNRALDVLTARTESLMVEASEVPRQQWSVSGEHNNDARRAFQIAALAIAADPEKYDSIAKGIGMSEKDIRKSRDYGTEIHRSWRRVLQPLWMPDNTESKEVRIKYDPDNTIISQMQASGLTKDIESIARRFDWHSQISINFVQGEGGASWSRSRRTIDIHSEYILRFINQGEVVRNSDGK